MALSTGWIAALLTALGMGGGLLLSAERQVERAEERYPPLGRRVEVAGVRLHVTDEGSGPPVVLVHGLGSSLRAWRYGVADSLVAAGHRVVTLDRPGYGYSGRPRPELDPRAQAALVDALLDTLEIPRPVVLVGMSWGGSVAAALALAHPGDVRALVLVSPYILPDPRPLADYLFHLAAIPGLSHAAAYTAGVPAARAIQPYAVRRVFAPEPVPEGYPITPADTLILTLRPRSLLVYAGDMRVINAALRELWPRYGSLAMPVGVVLGEGDHLIDPAPTRALGDSLGWRVTLLDSAGHAVHVTRPGRVAAAILRAANAGSQ